MKLENPVELTGEPSALVIVDMQVEGCERHGPSVRPVVRNIQALLSRFRETNRNVIHIQSIRSKDHPEFTVFGKKYALLENSPGIKFVEELEPLDTETVVRKNSHDPFYRTSLDAELETLGLRPCRDSIVITGIGSNNCVYHAVIGFHVRNYFVIVPEDCIHASRPEGQAFALSQFRSSAYNFNITLTQSENIRITSGIKEGLIGAS